MAVWQVVRDDRVLSAFALEAGRPLVIGRARAAQVVLDDASVSLRHAVLALRAGQPVIADLGSRSGTRVGGQPVSGEAELGPGEGVEIGPFRLNPAPPGAASPRQAAPAPEAEIGDQPRDALALLLVVEGPARPLAVRVSPERAVLVGSAPHCDLRVQGWTAAAVQLMVVPAAHGHVLRPQARWREITINGRRVRGETPLQPGDRIATAGVTLLYQ